MSAETLTEAFEGTYADGYNCSCGHRLPSDDPDAELRAHLAAVLTSAARDREEEL